MRSLTSNTVSIPPWIADPTPAPKPGAFYVLLVSATPRLSETVTVTVRGAGADFNATFPASDFRSTSTTPTAVGKRIDVPFTQAGTVTVTAVVTGGPLATKTFEVVSGGRATTRPASLVPFALMLLALLRRRS